MQFVSAHLFTKTGAHGSVLEFRRIDIPNRILRSINYDSKNKTAQLLIWDGPKFFTGCEEFFLSGRTKVEFTPTSTSTCEWPREISSSSSYNLSFESEEDFRSFMHLTLKTISVVLT